MSTGLSRVIVFVTSAAVLVIEILAVRLVAPYLGVSLETFTGVIGVILAGIAFGAWAGGRAADRRPPAGLLGPLLVVSGLLALVSPLIVDGLGPSIGADAASIVALTFFSFFAPAAVLSAVPPVIVKIQLASIEETGSVVGSYSAVGTVGALFGTFITGFVLIAAFPTRPMVAVLGALLIVGGVTLMSTRRLWGLASLIASLLAGSAMLLAGSPCDYETTYHCALVEEDPDRPDGKVLVLDRLRNSYVDVGDPTYLEFRYIRTMADIVDATFEEQTLRVVSIGGGGFTFPGYVEATRPGSSNAVYEIDGALTEIVSSELALSESIAVFEVDARRGIASETSDSADVVVGDAFSGVSVPWHLTTVEFVAEIERVLTDRGVYVMNVIDYGDFEFARSSAATLSEVFPTVVVFAPESVLSDGRGGNFVLAASASEIDSDLISGLTAARGQREWVIRGESLTRFIDGALVLRDDFAPVDQMLGSRS